MKMHGLRGMNLKTWRLKINKESSREYFMRINTNYLESSQHIEVTFIKRSWWKFWTIFWWDNIANSQSINIRVNALSKESRSSRLQVKKKHQATIWRDQVWRSKLSVDVWGTFVKLWLVLWQPKTWGVSQRRRWFNFRLTFGQGFSYWKPKVWSRALQCQTFANLRLRVQ